MNNGWLWPQHYIQELTWLWSHWSCYTYCPSLQINMSIWMLWNHPGGASHMLMSDSHSSEVQNSKKRLKSFHWNEFSSEFISTFLHAHKGSGGYWRVDHRCLRDRYGSLMHLCTSHTRTCTQTLICSQGQRLDPFPSQELAVALESHVAFAYTYVNMDSQCNAGKYYLLSTSTVA